MRRKGSLEKTLVLGTMDGKRRRGRQRMRGLDGVTEAVGVNMGGLRGMVEDRKAWRNIVHGVIMDSLSELMEIISDLVLRTLRMLVLGDFNPHAETVLTGAPQDFMASMMAVGLSGGVLGLVCTTTCLLDPCPSWLLIKAKDRMCTWVQEVVNASLGEGQVPTRLKEVVIRPILKRANLDPEMVTNYRLVANIPFLGKVLEQVVARQLQSLLEETDHPGPFQSGFRPSYGTETALVALYDDLCRERDKGSVSLLVLLDLSVAFDTIEHGEAVAVLNWSLARVMGWMRANKLRFDPDKTEPRIPHLVHFGYFFLGGDVAIVPVESHSVAFSPAFKFIKIALDLHSVF
ncbi:RNA-directed DNA polymerase from mobile element jockey [Varanus komodoensis]|nr:RNA-directed DNA polymerase from mobile element jockey [Varanus komodoensis]